MNNNTVVKKIFDNKPEGRKFVGRSRVRWLENVKKFRKL